MRWFEPRSVTCAQWLAACVVLCCAAFAGSPAAADEVYYASSDGEARQAGQITEYTGRELVIRGLNGRDLAIPASKVVRFEFERTGEHATADRLAAEGRFAEAAQAYARTLEVEPRAWTQRLVVSRMAICLAHLPLGDGGVERAGDLVLTILRHDPESPYLAALPLAWSTVVPLPALEKKAEQWLAAAAPPARLLGASWLVQTTHRRVAARQVLDALTREREPRVALLAEAQLWRLAYPNVTAADAGRMEQTLERIERPLRAGPYYRLGLARAALRQPEAAALALMRVPIDYPDAGPLAADALLEAAAQLRILNRREQAANLYREIVARHGRTLAATEAEQQLRDLAGAK